MPVVVPSSGQRLISLACRSVGVLVLALSAQFAHADDVGDVQKLLSAGKNVEALQKADQYLAGKPRDPMMRFLRGISLSQAGRTAEAITAFQKLTEDYPDLPEPFNNLAVLYAQQGQYDKSRTALEMAIRTNPSYATAYENLGDVYAKLASQAYSKALQIDTRSAVAPKLAMIRDLFPKDRGTAIAAAGGTPASTTTPVVPAAPARATPVAPALPVVPPVAAKPEPKVEAKPEPKVEAKPEVKAEPKAEPRQEPKGDAREREVEAALKAWAAAWSRRDVEDYFAAYTRDFDGGKTRKAWEAERRDRISSKRSISVKLSDIDVRINGSKAIVTFRQEYKADSLNVSSRKRLELVQKGNNWLIAKESAGS